MVKSFQFDGGGGFGIELGKYFFKIADLKLAIGGYFCFGLEIYLLEVLLVLRVGADD